eukprot:3134280-Heterocapsa_arctica.AAC.1
MPHFSSSLITSRQGKAALIKTVYDSGAASCSVKQARPTADMCTADIEFGLRCAAQAALRRAALDELCLHGLVIWM